MVSPSQENCASGRLFKQASTWIQLQILQSKFCLPDHVFILLTATPPSPPKWGVRSRINTHVTLYMAENSETTPCVFWFCKKVMSSHTAQQSSCQGHSISKSVCLCQQWMRDPILIPDELPRWVVWQKYRCMPLTMRVCESIHVSRWMDPSPNWSITESGMMFSARICPRSCCFGLAVEHSQVIQPWV